MGHSYHSELYITVGGLDHLDHLAEARLNVLKAELVRDYELNQRWDIDEWSTTHYPEHMRVRFTSIKCTPVRLCQEISQEHAELTLDFKYSNMHELGVRGMGFFHKGKGRICENYKMYEADADGMWRVYPPEASNEDESIGSDPNQKRATSVAPPDLSALMRDAQDDPDEDVLMLKPVTERTGLGNQITDQIPQQTVAKDKTKKMIEADTMLPLIVQWHEQWGEIVMAALFDCDVDVDFVTKAFERIKKLLRKSRIGSEIKARIATGEIPTASAGSKKED